MVEEKEFNEYKERFLDKLIMVQVDENGYYNVKAETEPNVIYREYPMCIDRLVIFDGKVFIHGYMNGHHLQLPVELYNKTWRDWQESDAQPKQVKENAEAVNNTEVEQVKKDIEKVSEIEKILFRMNNPLGKHCPYGFYSDDCISSRASHALELISKVLNE